MSIFSEIKSFYSSAMNGWHYGKGLKYSKKEDYKSAFKHFHLAAKYAEDTNNDGTMAIDLESLAVTCYRLKNFNQARVHADKSLNHYKKCQASRNSKVINEGIARVENLIKSLTT